MHTELRPFRASLQSIGGGYKMTIFLRVCGCRYDIDGVRLAKLERERGENEMLDAGVSFTARRCGRR